MKLNLTTPKHTLIDELANQLPDLIINTNGEFTELERRLASLLRNKQNLLETCPEIYQEYGRLNTAGFILSEEISACEALLKISLEKNVLRKFPKLSFLEEIQNCTDYIEPDRPNCEHSNILREFTDLEKKIYTLMVQKNMRAKDCERKSDEADLLETDLLYEKRIIKVGNETKIVPGKRNNVPDIPFLGRKRKFYQRQSSIAWNEAWAYKKLLLALIAPVRTECYWDIQQKDIFFAKGFVFEMIKPCRPGVTWVMYADEWQAV